MDRLAEIGTGAPTGSPEPPEAGLGVDGLG